MRRTLVLSIVGLVMWAPAAGASHDGSVCADSRFADIQAAYGPACIPLAATPWRKYQMAAVSFWWRQSPPSPRTTKWGNNGAWGYPVPFWCRDARPTFYFPHGVTNVLDTAHPEFFGYTTIEGMPPAGSSSPDGEPGPCTIYMKKDMMEAGDLRMRCTTYLHEWGHLLGWSHDNYSSVIMRPGATPPPSAADACRSYGM